MKNVKSSPAHVHPDGAIYAPKHTHLFVKVQRKKMLTGYGLFAGQDIVKGAIIAKAGGLVVTSIADFPKNFNYAVLIAPKLYVAPYSFDKLEDIWFLNHSCNSNMARVGGLIYFAKRGIQAGEQLTVDYAPMVAGEENWHMECLCAQPNCRKLITGDDWKQPAVAKDLWIEWLPHIQNHILKSKVL
jgi:hypothetical protein